MSAITTRLATTAELDAVADLFDQYRGFYGKPGDLALARRFIGERMEKRESVILVADAKDGLAGFTQLYPSFSSVSAARTYVLNDLFVTPAFRRQGVARRLLEAARAFAMEAGALRLSLATAMSNAPAQALYEGLGWVRDREFYYYAWPVPTRRSD